MKTNQNKNRIIDEIACSSPQELENILQHLLKSERKVIVFVLKSLSTQHAPFVDTQYAQSIAIVYEAL